MSEFSGLRAPCLPRLPGPCAARPPCRCRGRGADPSPVPRNIWVATALPCPLAEPRGHCASVKVSAGGSRELCLFISWPLFALAGAPTSKT